MTASTFDSDSDYDFEDGEAEYTGSHREYIGDLKKGGFIVMNNRPAKIAEMKVSGTGKHGTTKATIVAKDLFTGAKMQSIYMCSERVEVPVVTKTEMEVTDIAEDGALTLMDAKGNLREDLFLPKGQLGEDIKKAFDQGTDAVLVTICSALKEEAVFATRRRK